MKRIELEQGSDEWLKWRTEGFGSSDVAGILNLSKYSSPYQVYLNKKGIGRIFDGNNATRAGQDVEPKARASYEILHGEFEEFKPICVEHDKYPFMRASLDGYSEKLKRIVEIKYPSNTTHLLALSGVLPSHYLCQVQYQLLICDEATHAHYWSYRESQGGLVEVKRAEAFLNEVLIPGVLAFQKLIETNTPPPLTEQDALWMDDPHTLSLFEELSQLNEKRAVSDLAQKILMHCGHTRVRTRLGLVTSIKRHGVHNHYRFTKAVGE
jgi:putative phage-type endonuclease